MTQKKKAEYQSPQAFEVETVTCNMLCASIVVSDEEVNTQGRASRRRDAAVWSEGLWNKNR
jgi:hypothetical protein